MDQDNKIIYENTKKNSIGLEKKCEYKKVIKRGTLKVAAASLISTFVIAAFTGCQVKFQDNELTDDIKIEKNFNEDEDSNTKEETVIQNIKTQERNSNCNGFTIVQIANYEMSRAKKLFSENGFTEYEKEGLKRNYLYSKEDYKKIDALDESYLYGIFLSTTQNTFEEVLKALGYSNFEEFLIRNGYVDKKGEVSMSAWRDADLEEISMMMKEEKGVKIR